RNAANVVPETVALGRRRSGAARERQRSPEDDFVTRAEDAYLRFRRQVSGCPLELLRRLGEKIQLPERRGNRVQRAPGNRDGDAWLEHAARLGGLQRIQVPVAQRRPPTPDRQQRDVDIIGYPRHAGEELGVTRKVGGARALHEVADRLGGRPERRAVA